MSNRSSGIVRARRKEFSNDEGILSEELESLKQNSSQYQIAYSGTFSFDKMDFIRLIRKANVAIQSPNSA